MFGLLFGIVVISFSVFVLHAVLTAPRSASVISRWFMMFLHLELILYIALVVVKLPLLCKIKDNFLLLMKEDCDVLRYMYAERAISRLIIGSLCCWVFSSYAYLLAWGDPTIDDPNLDIVDSQDLRLQAFRAGRVPTTGVVVPISEPHRVYAQPGVASSFRVTNDSYRIGDRYVGDAVSVSSKYEPHYVGGSSFQGGNSFAATSQRYPGTSQYIMPRASSSMQSHQSEATAERQMLIKPPIVIH
jgi:hypothetical protein